MERESDYSITTSQDFSGDGVMDSTTVETFRFNEKGLLIEQTSSADHFQDGVFDYLNVIRFAYDKHDRLVETINEDDNDLNHMVDNRVSDKFVYDERGNIVVTEHVSDYGADGFPEYRAVFEDSYNEDNQLINTVSRYENQGDPALDRVDTEWFTYGEDGYLETVQFDFFSDSTIDKTIVYGELV